MPNARLAEFLLRRATTPERASAIVGDLLEQHPHRSSLFAIAVARLLLALLWRQILGYASASICFLVPGFAFAKFALHFFLSGVVRRERFAITPSAAPLLFSCMALFAIAIFAFARPATRRIGLASLSLALTNFAAACYIFIHPASYRYTIAAVFCVAFLLTAVPATRRPSLISLASAVGLCATLLTIAIAATDLLNPYGKHFIRYDLSFFAFAWLTAIAAGTLTLTTLQRRFLPTPPPVIN